MTTIWAVRPWRSAFREERCLPSAVLGPVDSSALARLISVLFGVDMPWYTSGGSGVGGGGSGKGLKGRGLEGVGLGVIGRTSTLSNTGGGVRSLRSRLGRVVELPYVDTNVDAARVDACATRHQKLGF